MGYRRRRRTTRQRHSEVGFRHYSCGRSRFNCFRLMQHYAATAAHPSSRVPLERDSICLLIRQHSGSVSWDPLKSSQRLKLYIHDGEQCIGRQQNSLLCTTRKGRRVPWSGGGWYRRRRLSVEYEIFNFNSFMKAINNSCRMERFRKYSVVGVGPAECSPLPHYSARVMIMFVEFSSAAG